METNAPQEVSARYLPPGVRIRGRKRSLFTHWAHRKERRLFFCFVFLFDGQSLSTRNQATASKAARGNGGHPCVVAWLVSGRVPLFGNAPGIFMGTGELTEALVWFSVCWSTTWNTKVYIWLGRELFGGPVPDTSASGALFGCVSWNSSSDVPFSVYSPRNLSSYGSRHIERYVF